MADIVALPGGGKPHSEDVQELYDAVRKAIEEHEHKMLVATAVGVLAIVSADLIEEAKEGLNA